MWVSVVQGWWGQGVRRWVSRDGGSLGVRDLAWWQSKGGGLGSGGFMGSRDQVVGRFRGGEGQGLVGVKGIGGGG